MNHNKLLIFSLMRTGCVHYSASMINKLSDLDPTIYISNNLHGLFPHSAKKMPTYFGPISAFIHSIFATILLFFFVIYQKIKFKNLKFYFPAFHPWNFLLAIYARLFNIKTILTIHDYRSHLEENKPILNFLKKRTIKLADHVIFLSDHERDLAINASKTIKSKSTTLLHPLLDWPDLELNQLSHQKKPSILLFGRINAYKGLDLFTRAIEPIRYKFEKIVVAGKFQRKLKDQKKEFIEYIDKYLTEKEIAKLLTQFHILALPYSEATQSGVLPLGIQAGIPMVISKVGGLPEQIDQHSAVIVYPNSNDIRDGIESLLNESYYNGIKNNLDHFRIQFEENWDEQFKSIKNQLFR